MSFMYCSFPSPPHAPHAESAIEVHGCLTIHLRGHIVVSRNLLLNGELLVMLVFLFAADVSDALLLVLVNIKDAFVGNGGALNFVSCERSIDLFLPICFRRPYFESSRAQQRLGV